VNKKGFGVFSLKILVTGASGRVGREVVKEISAKKGIKLRLLGRSGEKLKAVFPKLKGIEFVSIDLARASSSELQKVCEGIDCIVHLAALVDLTAPEWELVEANAVTTKKLADAAKLVGVKKFVLLSSTSVYGYGSENPVSETTPFSPDSSYGRSKTLAEEVLGVSGVHFIALRPPIIFGKEFKEGFEQIVHGIEKRKLKLVGRGNNFIALIHVSDVASAVAKAVFSEKAFGGYVICGERVTQKQAFDAVAQELGVESPKRISKRIAYALARASELKARLLGRKSRIYPELLKAMGEERIFDCSRAGRDLGWKPKVDTITSIRETVRSWVA
jgi:nucleoside-diphosphate-sugar epimerase